ncbi:hypothetical protein BEH61_07960 [Clavibacter michiganensis subsp. insidiosus]|nr:hypothetical protein BEH61_07960 [Clavibacter michiganensis subsp. insidiosus]
MPSACAAASRISGWRDGSRAAAAPRSMAVNPEATASTAARRRNRAADASAPSGDRRRGTRRSACTGPVAVDRARARTADRTAIPADTSATDAATTADGADAPRTPIASAVADQPTAAGIASRRSTAPDRHRLGPPEPPEAPDLRVTPAPAG